VSEGEEGRERNDREMRNILLKERKSKKKTEKEKTAGKSAVYNCNN